MASEVGKTARTMRSPCQEARRQTGSLFRNGKWEGWSVPRSGRMHGTMPHGLSFRLISWRANCVAHGPCRFVTLGARGGYRARSSSRSRYVWESCTACPTREEARGWGLGAHPGPCSGFERVGEGAAGKLRRLDATGCVPCRAMHEVEASRLPWEKKERSTCRVVRVPFGTRGAWVGYHAVLESCMGSKPSERLADLRSACLWNPGRKVRR